MSVTFHVALLLGSEDTYADRPATMLNQEGELDGWNFRLSAGGISESVREYITTRPPLLDALLNGVFGHAPKEWIESSDPIAARDNAIAEAAAEYSFSPPWDDNERLFTTIEVWKQVSVSLDPERGTHRYFWYDLGSAEQVLQESYSGGVEAAQAILASLLPQMGESQLFHNWKTPLRWLEVDGARRCLIPTFSAHAGAVVRRASSEGLIQRLAAVSVPQALTPDIKRRLGTIGRWHTAAAAEDDPFRRFLWHFAGLEVVSKAVSVAGRSVLSALLSYGSAAAGTELVIRELLWPSQDDGRDPNRNLVFSFSAMAVLLSPHTAAVDLQAFRTIARYRNQIHGGALDPAAAPLREIIDLWRRYSPLAAEFLISPGSLPPRNNGNLVAQREPQTG
ncbi:hypothetical protein ACIBP4_07460 [Micromonospora maritima]|uniref:Apea-like HEPN domain-containing protein n=1 Tax=Micromonospora maritima TaxID=986711 RepID=A0ABW7ZH27_9ACTN